MRRRSCFIVLALLTLLVPPRPPVIAAVAPTYIALGDSIAAGVGSSLPRERGYAALVRDLLSRQADDQVTLEQLAVPGETATSFVEAGQLDRFRSLVERLRQSDIPIAAVTLSLGGNDMLRVANLGDADRQTALDAFQSSFPAALDSVRAAIGPNVPIVVTTYYDLTSGDPGVQGSDAWWLGRFNEVISATAEANGARVAAVSEEFAGRIDSLTLHPVDIHPSNAGHEAIATAVWRSLACDTTAPTIDAPDTLAASRLTPTLRFAAQDDTGVSELTIEASAGRVAGPFADGPDWLVLVDLHEADGPVTVSIEAVDAAGNTATETMTVNPPDQAP